MRTTFEMYLRSASRVFETKLFECFCFQTDLSYFVLKKEMFLEMIPPPPKKKKKEKEESCSVHVVRIHSHIRAFGWVCYIRCSESTERVEEKHHATLLLRGRDPHTRICTTSFPRRTVQFDVRFRVVHYATPSRQLFRSRCSVGGRCAPCSSGRETEDSSGASRRAASKCTNDSPSRLSFMKI